MRMAEETQKKRKKKRRKKNYILRAFVLIALGTGVYYWLTSPFFDVQRIVVENNRHYTREQIIRMAGATVGQNIFTAETALMRDALLKDPYIRSVRVRRVLPSDIVITVEERVETAKVPYADLFIVIDNDGLILRMTDARLRLPILIGMTVKTMEPGGALEVEEPAVLTETLRFLEVMEKTNMFFHIIDVSNVVARLYVYAEIVCEGTLGNIKESLTSGRLERVLFERYTQGITRGIIRVRSEGYISFHPGVD